MCCVYIRNVQHHIDTAMLKAARKEILVFHIREQLRLRQACTFETKYVGAGLDTNCLALTFRYFRKSSFGKHLEMIKCPEKTHSHFF